MFSGAHEWGASKEHFATHCEHKATILHRCRCCVVWLIPSAIKFSHLRNPSKISDFDHELAYALNRLPAIRSPLRMRKRGRAIGQWVIVDLTRYERLNTYCITYSG